MKKQSTAQSPKAKTGKSEKDFKTSRLSQNVTEASKNARKIYFLYIGFLIYCALTVVGMSDRQIILNDAVHLPIIGMDVYLDGFFILSPVIAIFVFIYLQLYIAFRRELINELRQEFPELGREHLYPWMLVALDYPKKGFVGRFQNVFVIFSVWFSLPIVLGIISTWFAKTHDPVLAYGIGLSPLLGAIIVFPFWTRYKIVQQENNQKTGVLLNNIAKIVLILIVIAYEFIFLLFIVPVANAGFPQVGLDESNKRMERHLKSFFCIDLSYQKLVTRPDEEYKGIYWADLNGVHLEGATLISTVMEKADLRRAQLPIVKMTKAVLQEANLEEANLAGSDLKEANLQEAYLWHADMREVNLEGANLFKAELWLADLRGANLKHADLREALLGKARLQGADLWFAKLQGAEFWMADLQGANFLKADMQGVSLEGANLQGAKLWKVNLEGANFDGANLEGVDLRGANLQGARNLNADQFEKTKTLYEAELNPILRKEIEKRYPWLLEVPEEK